MQYGAETSFSLRDGERSILVRRWAWIAAALLAAASCAMSGCAENPNFPSLAKITNLDNILTPEERQKAVQDLQKQEQTHGPDAAKAIERRDQ